MRNLFWLLFSPAIKVSEPYENSELIFPEELQNKWLELHSDWFLELDHTTALNDFLAIHLHSMRLGIYAEKILLFFFHHSPHIELVWYNRQIIENEITRTEIDFVIRFEDKLIHIELAVKFYLENHNGEWIGPNPRDTLKDKWDKVQSLQLPEAKREIEYHFPNEQVTSYFFVKGYLFTRNDNDTCQWIYKSELESFLSSGYRFALLEKPRLMADLTAYRGETISKSICSKHILSDTKKAIAALSLSKKNQLSYYIVEDGWPFLDDHR